MKKINIWSQVVIMAMCLVTGYFAGVIVGTAYPVAVIDHDREPRTVDFNGLEKVYNVDGLHRVSLYLYNKKGAWSRDSCSVNFKFKGFEYDGKSYSTCDEAIANAVSESSRFGQCVSGG